MPILFESVYCFLPSCKNKIFSGLNLQGETPVSIELLYILASFIKCIKNKGSCAIEEILYYEPNYSSVSERNNQF